MSAPPSDTLAPGFESPVHQAQEVFRVLLDATSRPGRPVAFVPAVTPPPPLSASLASIALTLCDHDAPVWLDTALDVAEVRDWLRFHTGCPLTSDSSGAAFAFVSDPLALPTLAAFATGTPDYPDRSTTICVSVDELRPGSGWRLSGPGIDGEARLAVAPVRTALVEEMRRNHDLFPQGVDLVFVSSDGLAALPRSTRVGV